MSSCTTEKKETKTHGSCCGESGMEKGKAHDSAKSASSSCEHGGTESECAEYAKSKKDCSETNCTDTTHEHAHASQKRSESSCGCGM